MMQQNGEHDSISQNCCKENPKKLKSLEKAVVKLKSNVCENTHKPKTLFKDHNKTDSATFKETKQNGLSGQLLHFVLDAHHI